MLKNKIISSDKDMIGMVFFGTVSIGYVLCMLCYSRRKVQQIADKLRILAQILDSSGQEVQIVDTKTKFTSL